MAAAGEWTRAGVFSNTLSFPAPAAAAGDAPAARGPAHFSGLRSRTPGVSSGGGHRLLWRLSVTCVQAGRAGGLSPHQAHRPGPRSARRPSRPESGLRAQALLWHLC